MKACPKCGGSAFKWFWSPHFHIVGFGWLENISEGYARHGWIVKGLGVRKSVFWTFQYLLSHAGVSRFHTTTWFGNMGYHALRVLRLPRLRELCPECGAEFRPLIWIGKEEPPPFEYNEEDPSANDFLGSSSDWRNLG
jgi:ribosomal protein S27AE